MKHAATTLGLLLAGTVLAACADAESPQPAASDAALGQAPAQSIEADRRYCRNLAAGQQVRGTPEARETARRHRNRAGARAFTTCMEARGWQLQ